MNTDEDWIGEIKKRYGIRCTGDEPAAPELPEWPVLPEGTRPGDWRVVSDHAMASWDGVHFYVKPDDMTMAEWRDSLR